jgi:serine/threonine protein kinase
MLTGRLPFGGENAADVVAAATRGIYQYRDKSISADCRKLIRSLLTVSPDERATVYDVINSRWMNPGVSKPIQPIPSFGLHAWQQKQRGNVALAREEHLDEDSERDSSRALGRSPRFWKLFTF